MEIAIARIGRDNHLNNLIAKLPLITTIFALQCFFLMQVEGGEIDVGYFASLMGCFLILLVSTLFVYDKYHHVIIYKSQIVVYFAPLNAHRVIELKDIKSVVAPQKECDFSSISIQLKTGEIISFHFVDYPVQVKTIIEDLMQGLDVSEKIKPAA